MCRFLWDESDTGDSWEVQLARRYYDKLFKEYCIVDLSRWVGIGNNVGDLEPDPDPQDPHVFEPPGSGFISQRYGSGSGFGSFPFLINVLSRLKKTQNF